MSAVRSRRASISSPSNSQASISSGRSAIGRRWPRGSLRGRDEGSLPASGGASALGVHAPVEDARPAACQTAGRWSTRARLLAGGGRRGRSRPPSWTATSRPTSSSSAAASPGSGRPGTSSSWSRRRGSSCSRRTVRRGPSGRNGGFCNVMWFSLPNMRRRWGDEAALAVARAADRAVGEIGEFCEREGVDAWFRKGGYLQVSTAPAHDAVWARRSPPAASWARRTPCSRSRRGGRGRCASPAFRGGAFYPARRRCSRRGWRWGCASACGRGAWSSTSARRCGRCAMRRRASRPAPPPARSGPAPRSSRSARPPRRGGPAAQPPHGHLLPHRPHRAGPRAARGGRLDRGRVHHRQPRPDRLLPHHPRRPHRLRLGRWPDRDGRTPARPRRARPRGRRTAAERLWTTSPASGAAASPTPGAARSTPPRPTSRWSFRSRRPRLRRRRLHRQRRRPLAHGRPHPRLPRPRPPRRALAPAVRRPLAPPRPP